MPRPRKFACLGLLGCVAWAGCAPSVPSTESQSASASRPEPDLQAAQDPLLKVTMTPVDPAGFRQRVAAREGQVVLVDFWASWCVPCMQAFPHTLELSHKYGERGLAVLSMSCDDPADEAQVLAFLERQQADIENLMTAVDVNATFEAFDIKGGIPFYQLYDRRGQLRYEFNGQPEPEDGVEPMEQIEQRILELLAETAP